MFLLGAFTVLKYAVACQLIVKGAKKILQRGC